MRIPPFHHIIVLLLPLMLFACARSRHGELFDDMERRIEADPRAAAAYADSLAADSALLRDMTEYDRARFGLLRIKSADKAYIRHTSDSLLLTVTEYYDRHPKAEEYAEALYYGGRVYADLGDSPTALRYFQQAIDALPQDKGDESLRRRILSQTGRKLNSLRLYDQAVPYLEEVVRLEEKDSLTKNFVYNLELLGAVYMHAGHNDQADSLFRRALRLSINKWPSLAARQNMYLAGLKLKEGNIDDALSLIRNVPQKISDDYIGTALGYAAEIYLKADKPDTALMYAKRLAEDSTFNNQKNGYYLIFSSQLLNKLPADSIVPMIIDYAHVVDKYVSKNGDRYALIQNATYNYSKHVHARFMAEKKSSILKTVVIIILTIAFCLVLFICHQRIRTINTELMLYKTREEFNAFREFITKPENVVAEYERIIKDSLSPAVKEAQDRMRKVILQNYASIDKVPEPSPLLLNSQAYEKISFHLKTDKGIVNSAPLWKEIHETIDQIYPNFFNLLDLLTGHTPESNNLHLAMLLKFGITSSQAKSLLCIQKSSITSRREKLSESLFGVKLDYRVLNAIIRSI